MKALGTRDTQKSELARFAQSFHQDFGLMYGSASEGAAEYIRGLSSVQKLALAKDLRNLLHGDAQASEQSLRKTWRRLGAEWWNRKTSLTKSIEAWIQQLVADAT